MASTFAWLAFVVGVVSTWITGKHRVGWLITALAAFMWLCFGIIIRQPAEVLASTLSIVLSIRNYVVWNHGHNISDSNNS